MSVLITGSIAYDTIFRHAGTFSENLKPEALDCLNLTFQAAGMERSIGGCAANIAAALKLAGGTPALWGCVGRDGADIMAHFRLNDIPTDGIGVAADCYTSQCVITTDRLGNQLATFYPGALRHAHEAPYPERLDPALAILAPGCRDSMLKQAAAIRDRRLPMVLDLGQTLPVFTHDEIDAFVEASRWIAFSDYEAELLRDRAGLTPDALAREGKIVFQTHGSAGSSVWTPEAEAPVLIPVEAVPNVNPVGAGDAYRGGLLRGLEMGLDPVECAKLGTETARRTLLKRSAG